MEALEADTGKEIWQAPVTGGAPSRRGVAYWPGEGRTPPRIFFMAGRRLIALDAKTGAAASPSDKTERLILECRTIPVPGIFRNVIVVGANTPPGASGGIGNARAFDARTGVRCQEFSSVLSLEPSGTTPGTATAGRVDLA